MSLKGSQAYIYDMLERPEPEEGPSEIVQFFAGLNVFVTGGSGFLGKLLIEKLLRTCTGINKLYVLLRTKKGKSLEERFEEILSDPLFDKLKKDKPKSVKKIVIVEGDVSLIDLGLSTENRELLMDTHVIFHGAATVRFDEALRKTAHINVRGTKQMVLLAKEMPFLKAFVHVSTAYSHCTRKVIDEKFYKPPMSTDNLLALVEMFDDEKLERIKDKVLGRWPNTYAFTKAIAEDTVRQYSEGVPSCVTRPSIVTPTMEDPISGWIDNFYGATGVLVGAAMGIIRTLHCGSENIADIIPGDYVVSNIIAAAWEIATRRCVPQLIGSYLNLTDVPASIPDADEKLVYPCTSEVVIYNIVASCQNPLIWRDFMEQSARHGLAAPIMIALWYYNFRLTRQKRLHEFLGIFLHWIPALIVDSATLLVGQKPRLLSTYKKIGKFGEVISYFSTQQWTFKNDNVVNLWGKLNSGDRRLFHFFMGDHMWDVYLCYVLRGIRVYLMKDPMDTLPASKRRYARLKFAHYTILVIFWAMVAYGVYTLISIFSTRFFTTW